MLTLVLISFILAGTALIVLGLLFILTYTDPRWRGFNFHSRVATESDIYTVFENPVISKVRHIDDHTQRLDFLPPISTTSWDIEYVHAGIVKSRPCPDLSFSGAAPQNETFILTPQGRFFDKALKISIEFYPSEN